MSIPPSHSAVRDRHPEDGIRFPDHPLESLNDLFLRASRELPIKRQLGMLSVSVLQNEPNDNPETWQSYDGILGEIRAFLADFQARRMRTTDQLFWPSIIGNGFVILLDAPRTGRPLNGMDVSRVRFRLRRSLRKHLNRTIPARQMRTFGVYVGGSLMRHESGIPISRIVYRSREEAFADALKDKDREGRRYSNNLRKVIEGEQVQMVYQPVLDLVDRKVIGLEALTRVPRSRFPSPEVLFKTAHQNNTLWTLERLCRNRALAGLPRLLVRQKLFLNVEPDSLHDPHLLEKPFSDRLREAGLCPQQIVLEITERTAIQDFTMVRRMITRCRHQGYRVAMDDVGSGYAGLQAIAEISPDYIKMDMSLVRDIHRHSIKRELVTTIRRFSDSTGIILVAEGVEIVEELQSLMHAGVRCAQGYLFSKPARTPAEPDWDSIPSSG